MALHNASMTAERIPREVRGVFHSRVTRDAMGRERDGEPFFEANLLSERVPSSEGELFEVRFRDGVWMLARTPDLTFVG